MAAYKNQHFVPRSYLRAFSLDGAGDAINLFNIHRKIGVQNAALKHQCSRNFFYGEDLRLEKLLQISEGLYASMLRAIRSEDYQLAERDRILLRHFCYLQRCRTEAAAKRGALFVSEFSDVAFGEDVPPSWKIAMRDAIALAMYSFATTRHVIDDLKVCLVRNQTNHPFITSDDPVIATNRWYLQSDIAKGMSFGVGKAGALFMAPLTPFSMCILYDGDVYSLQNTGGWIVADRPSDVDALNQHQYLNCVANLYFADWSTRSQIENDFSACEHLRPTKRHEVITAVLHEEDEWGQRFRVVDNRSLVREGAALVHVRGINPKPNKWPSFIKLRSKPIIFSNGTGTGFVRPSRLAELQMSGPPYQRVTAR
jgi:hypothetical protein